LNKYKLLTYEAPFFRKGVKDDLPGCVKCDLIGLKEKDFCCIELKSNPTNEDTQISYALLEAFSYWVCANWIFKKRKTDFKKEVSYANGQRLNGAIKDIGVTKISFAIAVPSTYVDKYMGEDLLLIQMLEETIKKNWPASFAGYWILSSSPDLDTLVKKTKERDGTYIPQLTGELNVATHRTVSAFLK
jgi:hypothetical protein